MPQLVAGPAGGAGSNHAPGKDVRGLAGRVVETLYLTANVLPMRAAPPDLPPLEPCRPPIRAPEEGSCLVRDDVPARNGKREVELPDAQHAGPRHEVHVPGRFPDPRAPDEPERWSEPRVDAVE